MFPQRKRRSSSPAISIMGEEAPKHTDLQRSNSTGSDDDHKRPQLQHRNSWPTNHNNKGPVSPRGPMKCKSNMAVPSLAQIRAYRCSHHDCIRSDMARIMTAIDQTRIVS